MSGESFRDNDAYDDSDLSETVSIEDSVDIDYLKDMYRYELKAIKDTESINLSLEEENVIVDKIKQDILNQVRGEMGSELEKYQIVSNRTNTTIDSAVDDQMDPIIRQGLFQIKRLDKILLNKIKREKEVKRERILLQKRLREELNEIENANQNLSKEIKSNVQKFLALKPPLRHNEGLNEETAEDECPRLFQTEFIQEQTVNSPKTETITSTMRLTSNKPNKSQASNGRNLKKRNDASDTVKPAKNFIERNIELASKASEPIMLTDSEKERLDFLLSDLNNDSVHDSDGDDDKSKCLSIDYHDNPFQVISLEKYEDNEKSIVQSISQLSADDDISSIRYQMSIETKLRSCLGDENYSQLSRLDDKSVFADSLQYHALLSPETEIDVESLGETTLKEVKFSREAQKRLQEIDDKLNILKEGSDYCNMQLDESAMKALIISAREHLSQSTMTQFSDLNSEMEDEDSSTISDSKATLSMTKLSQDVLDSLLKEARMARCFNNTMEPIVELNETARSSTFSDSETFISSSSVARSTFGEKDGDKSFSRFPDINIYRQLTSPVQRK